MDKDNNRQHRLGQHYTSETKLLTGYKKILVSQRDHVVVDPFCGEAHLLDFYLSLFDADTQLSLLKSKKIVGYDVSERNISFVRDSYKKKYNLDDSLLKEIFQVRDSLLDTTVPKDSYHERGCRFT